MKYNGKFLGPAQKGAVSRAVQNNPNCTGSMVMKNLVNTPDDVIYIDHGLKESVDRLVRAERDVVLSRNLGGMSVGGNKHNEVHKLKNIVKKGASIWRSNDTTIISRRITFRAIQCLLRVCSGIWIFIMEWQRSTIL